MKEYHSVHLGIPEELERLMQKPSPTIVEYLRALQLLDEAVKEMERTQQVTWIMDVRQTGQVIPVVEDIDP